MTGIHVLTAEPIGEDILGLLEDALVRARAGELSSIGIAEVDRDGCVTTGWSKPPNMALLIGAVSRLQHRLHLRMDE